MSGPTRAPGAVDYSSGSNANFIPELWSSLLAPKFYAATVVSAISNTDYEGQIKEMGDKVNIRVIPDTQIFDYEVGGGINYQQPDSTAVVLNIDRAKGFGVPVNSVDEYQSDINLMNMFTNDAGEQMKQAIDRDILGKTSNGFHADIVAANKGATAGEISGNINLGTTTTPLVVTSTNVVEFLVNLGVVLDESNTPEEGRWVVLPAWLCGRIKNSDLKDASLAGDSTSIARNGEVGMIDRFTVYMSNNLKAESTYTRVYAGHQKGLAFASQINKTETLTNPNDFGDLVRGLNVYGFKVINGTLLSTAVIHSS